MQEKTIKFYPENINWLVIEHSLCGRKIFPSDRSEPKKADIGLIACIDKTLGSIIENSKLSTVQKKQRL